MPNKSFDRYVRRVFKPLDDVEELYYVTLLRHSPHNKAAAEALIANRVKYLLATVQKFAGTLVLCGMEFSDVLPFMHDSLLSVMRNFDPAQGVKRFGTAWSASLRFDLIDHVRTNNHVVHIPRQQFRKRKSDDSFVKNQFVPIQFASAQMASERALAKHHTPPSPEMAFLHMLVRDRAQKMYAGELTPRERIVLEDHVLQGRTAPKTVDAMAEAGLPRCTDSYVSQIKAILLKKLADL